ncbi:hypothetical protein ACOMCU_00875 [Lysinibacillus sp. UGB7]|uniref:hypothetical protein n=1 Tax=Lysinibacillus sp. UGB7 TaxID=3411039 RepID=UPI003B76BBD5
MDFSTLQEGQKINYIGDNLFAFGGEYTLYPMKKTYHDPTHCPIEDRGKLVIIELMNDDTPMYFKIDMIDANEWELVTE